MDGKNYKIKQEAVYKVQKETKNYLLKTVTKACFLIYALLPPLFGVFLCYSLLLLFSHAVSLPSFLILMSLLWFNGLLVSCFWANSLIPVLFKLISVLSLSLQNDFKAAHLLPISTPSWWSHPKSLPLSTLLIQHHYLSFVNCQMLKCYIYNSFSNAKTNTSNSVMIKAIWVTLMRNKTQCIIFQADLQKYLFIKKTNIQVLCV